MTGDGDDWPPSLRWWARLLSALLGLSSVMIFGLLGARLAHAEWLRWMLFGCGCLFGSIWFSAMFGLCMAVRGRRYFAQRVLEIQRDSPAHNSAAWGEDA